MNKTLIMLSLVAAAALGTPAIAQQNNAAHEKVDRQKAEALDDMRYSEDAKAKKAMSKAEQKYRDQVDKSTRAAAAARAKAEQKIEATRQANIRKGELSIERKYADKHTKIQQSDAAKQAAKEAKEAAKAAKEASATPVPTPAAAE